MAFVLSMGACEAVVAKMPELDEYGGFSDIPVPKANIGRWGTAKIGNRWFLVTPAGNAFINLGVYNLGQGSGKDDRGKSYSKYWHEKYGGDAKSFCTAQLERLHKWGFNSLADYAYNHCRGYTKIGSTLPKRTPSFTFPINGSSYSRRNVGNLINGHVKEIIRPCNKNYRFYGAKVVDYYDPKFSEYIEKRLVSKYASTVNNPFCIGISTDESDNLYGFGAGDRWNENHANAHLGLVAAVVPPTQEIEPDGKWIYIDKTTYIKQVLKKFLKTRYKNIERLNAVWGSNYSTFESDGGWEKGNGFLDEDGRPSHKVWLGKDANLSDGSANKNVKKDLDDFLFQIAEHYFKTYHDIIKKYHPNVLQVGPMTIGSWGQPPRKQILKAAGAYLDILRTGLKEPNLKEKINYTINHLGKELPMIAWIGATANADSGLYKHPFVSPLNQRTQELRAKYYRETLKDLLQTPSVDGTYLFCGIQFWEWTDHWGEKVNWGLVTIRDNAYDGIEAVKVVGKNAIQLPIGGEDKNFGNFVSGVSSANYNVYKIILKTDLNLKSSTEDDRPGAY